MCACNHEAINFEINRLQELVAHRGEQLSCRDDSPTTATSSMATPSSAINSCPKPPLIPERETMKLTNQIRDAFIKAAMSDVPQVDYQAKAVELAKDWVNAQMAVIFPGVDLTKAEPWLERCSLNMPGELRCFYAHAPSFDFLRCNPVLWAELKGLNKKLQAQTKQRGELEEQLRGCAYSVTTRKALAELLPEFAHYLPSEATPARMLPATTGVVNAFHTAGWPKKSQSTTCK
jgi:hypothetical protein